jgi:nucleoid-associated protein YgaU
MRKDVKFGITIGAILVVTLVIYVIVLSRNPAVPQKLGITFPSQNDQTAQNTDSTLPPSDDVAKANPGDSGNSNSEPGANSGGNTGSNPNAGSAPTPTPNDESASMPPGPATRPAPPANAGANASNDWDTALNNGLPPALSAPQHTETPSIDNSSNSLAHAPVNRPAGAPLIDSIPSTQPAPLYASNSPMMDSPTANNPSAAPAMDPAPAHQPVVDPTADPAPAGPRTHRVEPGESLYSIAQTLYGSGKYYKQILAANPNLNPHRLRIGQVLVIPELPESPKPPADSTSAAASPAADNGKTYTVASGDSLESISHKLYGSAAMVGKIYEFNKTLIGDNENVLKVGWVLKLPVDAPAPGDSQ